MTHPRYPHLLEPITLGAGPDALTLRNRVVMGSMHTGLEDHPWDIDKLAAFFEERARGGVGLIITGGYAPTKRGWLKPFASEMTNRLHAKRHERVTGPVHDAGGAIALQVLHAGRYGYHPLSQSASRQEVADHAVQAERDVDQGRRPHRDRLREERRARAEGGLRRRRDHGLRGLPHQPVPRRPHQRPRRPVGRVGRAPHALPRRGRTPLARAGRRRLPDRLPDLPARPGRGRPDLGGDRRARAAPAGRRRHGLQHRHRLARGAGPDDHHAGAARRLAVLHRSAQAGRRRPGLRVEPDQHPRARRGDPRERRGRPGLDGPPAAGRRGLRRQGDGRARRRDQHLHRLQPGLPRPRVRQRARLLPGQPARLPRDRAGAHADAAQADGGRRRRRTGRPRRGRQRGRARLRRDPLREVSRARRPVPPGDGRPRQGGLRRHPALLHPSPRGPRCRRTPLDGGHRRRPRRLRPGDRLDRRRAPDARRSPASTTRAWRRTPTC